MFDFSMFVELHFLLISVATILLFIWLIVPYFYLAEHVTRRGYTEVEASFLLSIIGVANFFGMVCSTYCDSYFLPKSICVLSVVFFCWRFRSVSVGQVTNPGWTSPKLMPSVSHFVDSPAFLCQLPLIASMLWQLSPACSDFSLRATTPSHPPLLSNWYHWKGSQRPTVLYFCVRVLDASWDLH